jgi:hypothetical protein
MFALSLASTRGNRRIPLSEIDAAVAARLGPGRVAGNAQPAVFSRQVGMYLASQVGGWSTTVIGRFYNGPDHSTVCYSISRIRSLRETEPEVDGLLSVLTGELEARVQSGVTDRQESRGVVHGTTAVIHQELVDAIADRVAQRVLEGLAASKRKAEPQPEVSDETPGIGTGLDLSYQRRAGEPRR